MNVTGIAGVGTKSSLLTVTLNQALRYCRDYGERHPNDPDKPQARAVILNVKGYDLFWLGQYSREFSVQDLEMWRAMGWADPRPMECDYWAPRDPRTDLAVAIGCPQKVEAYSWTLEDLLLHDLFSYLFSDGDRQDDNFQLLVADIERTLIHETRRGAK